MAGNIIARVKRPLPGLSPANVTLTANIKKGTDEILQDFTLVVEPWTHQEVLTANFNDLTDMKILGSNLGLNMITSNMLLPTVGKYGATISWSSPNTSFLSNTGTVTRPTFTQGDINLDLKATITSGSDTIEKTFTVTIVKQTQTTQEYLESYWTNSYQRTVLGANANKDAITTNLNLATEPGVSVVMTSSLVTRITNSGAVSRPAAIDGNAPVTLSFAITKDSVTINKTLSCVVLAQI